MAKKSSPTKAVKRSVRRSRLREENKALRQRVQNAEIKARGDEDSAVATALRHNKEIESEKLRTRQARDDADESRHRLKNVITVTIAIANATLTGDISLELARSAFHERLMALSTVHDILFNAGWDTANLAALISGVLAPYRSSRIRLRGPDVQLEPKPALALALALNELASNASKFGALSVANGSVNIAWTVDPTPAGKELRLRWHERNGPPVKRPTREGFGTTLIKKNLAAEFHGRVELAFQPDGVACTLVSPLT